MAYIKDSTVSVVLLIVAYIHLAERQRGHRKKRIAVSADLLNGPADDSDSDEALEQPEPSTGKSHSPLEAS